MGNCIKKTTITSTITKGIFLKVVLSVAFYLELQH